MESVLSPLSIHTESKLIIDSIEALVTKYNMALVAQWIEHQTSNVGGAGSSPDGGTFSNNS